MIRVVFERHVAWVASRGVESILHSMGSGCFWSILTSAHSFCCSGIRVGKVVGSHSDVFGMACRAESMDYRYRMATCGVGTVMGGLPERMVGCKTNSLPITL